MISGLIRRCAATAVVVALCLGVTGCGDNAAKAPGVSGRSIATLTDDLPKQVLGLSVARENVAKALTTVSTTYVEALAVYGFRRDKLLQATLQVSRFVKSSRYRTASFQQALIAGIGGTAPRVLELGHQTVYRTSGTSQQIDVWFVGDRFYVLAIRGDFPRPKSLLRSVVAAS